MSPGSASSWRSSSAASSSCRSRAGADFVEFVTNSTVYPRLRSDRPAGDAQADAGARAAVPARRQGGVGHRLPRSVVHQPDRVLDGLGHQLEALRGGHPRIRADGRVPQGRQEADASAGLQVRLVAAGLVRRARASSAPSATNRRAGGEGRQPPPSSTSTSAPWPRSDSPRSSSGSRCATRCRPSGCGRSWRIRTHVTERNHPWDGAGLRRWYAEGPPRPVRHRLVSTHGQSDAHLHPHRRHRHHRPRRHEPHLQDQSSRIGAYRDINEADAAIGVALALGELPEDIAKVLGRVQNDLFDVGADLATPVVENPEFPPLRSSRATSTSSKATATPTWRS